MELPSSRNELGCWLQERVEEYSFDECPSIVHESIAEMLSDPDITPDAKCAVRVYAGRSNASIPLVGVDRDTLLSLDGGLSFLPADALDYYIPRLLQVSLQSDVGEFELLPYLWIRYEVIEPLRKAWHNEGGRRACSNAVREIYEERVGRGYHCVLVSAFVICLDRQAFDEGTVDDASRFLGLAGPRSD